MFKTFLRSNPEIFFTKYLKKSFSNYLNDPPTIFDKIIARQIPAKIAYEDEKVYFPKNLDLD